MPELSHVILLSILTLVPLAGCPSVPTDEGHTVLVFFRGEFSEEQDLFTMEGVIGIGGRPSDESYNVTVNLHDKQGSVFHKFRVGPVAQLENVSLQSETIPEGVTLTSPDIQNEPYELWYFCRNGDWSDSVGDSAFSETQLLAACSNA